MAVIGDDEMYDYGDLSEGDMVSQSRPSQAGPSQADLLEAKLMQDNEIIGEAIDEFI